MKTLMMLLASVLLLGGCTSGIQPFDMSAPDHQLAAVRDDAIADFYETRAVVNPQHGAHNGSLSRVHRYYANAHRLAAEAASALASSADCDRDADPGAAENEPEADGGVCSEATPQVVDAHSSSGTSNGVSVP